MTIRCLFPTPEVTCSLEQDGYLHLQLHQQAAVGNMLIYANYIASLDGRIGLFDRQGECTVPASIANKQDWRLYQELAAQADIMITSARYFRQLAKGCAQDLLPVGQGDAYADLRLWREQQGLHPQPDIVIVSASLDIPLAMLAQFSDRQIWIATVESTDKQRRQAFEDQGIKVLMAGVERVDGGLLKQALQQQGYRSAYMIAGPALHHTLLVAGVVDRLFLTSKFALLGHDRFATILQGDMQPVVARLLSLYLDEQEGQFFAQYEIGGKYD